MFANTKWTNRWHLRLFLFKEKCLPCDPLCKPVRTRQKRHLSAYISRSRWQTCDVVSYFCLRRDVWRPTGDIRVCLQTQHPTDYKKNSWSLIKTRLLFKQLDRVDCWLRTDLRQFFCQGEYQIYMRRVLLLRSCF